MFCSFSFTAVVERSFFDMARFLDPSLDYDEVFFCNMSKVAGWFLLKKITKHSNLLYLCIFGKLFYKVRETSETESVL